MGLLRDQLFNEQAAEYAGPLPFIDISAQRSIVILDDDPTGCQTVHDVPVSFSWDLNVLKKLLVRKTPVFFILTNTRAMEEDAALSLINEVIDKLEAASKETGREFILVSRSDSTLRGHYPAELNAIKLRFSGSDMMECLIPAFFQGGRYTCDNIHYVKEGDKLIPAGETPFALDKAFGFKASDLCMYVEEKTAGKVRAEDVLSFSLEEIRTRGPEFVRQSLLNSKSPVCVVNALAQSDLDVFATGALAAIVKGKQMLFRTAASFLNSLAGISPGPLLERSDLISDNNNGGLIIVGSYVPKTTSQLKHLIAHDEIVPLELDVNEYLRSTKDELLASIADQVTQLVKGGKHVVLYTSRDLVHGKDAGESLNIGEEVSGALVEIVRKLQSRPSFIVSKGGITSHDIAVKGLKMRLTMVIGQALPGVPVLVSEEHKELKYIVFPGNVGNENSLLELFEKLK